MSTSKAYSQYSRRAARFLGKLISASRKEKKMTAQELAERAGISRTTLRKIETGDMTCAIGIVFEVAALVGVRLFAPDSGELFMLEERFEDKIALLPKAIRKSKKEVDDAF